MDKEIPDMKRFSRVVLPVCVLLLAGCGAARPEGRGVKNGILTPCPSTPNCVSSMSTDSGHSVDPLTYEQPLAAAVADMKKLILSMDRASIAEERENYLHAEFRSALFRFVDDVEFLFVDSTKTIHIRSASRVGSWDLGVNRRRVAEIRKRWRDRSK